MFSLLNLCFVLFLSWVWHKSVWPDLQSEIWAAVLKHKCPWSWSLRWNRDINVKTKAAGGQVQHCGSWIAVWLLWKRDTGGGRAGSLNRTCAGRKSRKRTGAIPGCTSSFVAVLRGRKRTNSLQMFPLNPNYVFSWREIKVRRRDCAECLAALH